MTWPGLDYHNHVCVTSFDEMLAAAAGKGVREYGISEHIFMLYEGQQVFPELQEEGSRFSRAWYVETLRERGASFPGQLRLGLEVDFVPGRESDVAAVLEGVEWDYLIGSIHEIHGHDLFHTSPTDESHADRLWRDYYRLFVRAVESGMFDVISHPVRNALLNAVVPRDFDDLLYDVAVIAARNGVALELNGDDTTVWPELVERLARACGRAGCAVSLGSDAHRPNDVARGLQRASEMALAARVPGVTTFQLRDRRVVPLD